MILIILHYTYYDMSYCIICHHVVYHIISYALRQRLGDGVRSRQ